VNVFVTGAGGFIGGHVVRYLGGVGCRVSAFSRHHYLGPPIANVEWLSGTLEDLTHESVSQHAPNAVVHAAAQNPGVGVTAESLERNNVGGTARLARAVGANAAVRVIYLSSISIYDDVAAPVVDEQTAVSNPSDYGMSKYRGELALSESLGPSRWIAIRLPGVVGRGATTAWPARIARDLMAGVPVNISNPDALFNRVVHVLDVCRFIEALLRQARFEFPVVNTGGCSPLTFRDVVSVLKASLGSESAMHEVAGAGHPFTIEVDRALSLGFPGRSVEETLKLYAADLLGAGSVA
jgi:nucleoside-diphosphate-sugar epimerase